MNASNDATSVTSSDAPAPTPSTAAGRPQRLLLQWHLSDRCNLRCAHCYQDDYRADGGDWSRWMTVLERFRVFLDGAAPDTGATPIAGQITLTGGEPFAHPEFPRLLEHLAALRAVRPHFSFAILSNGTLIDDAMARRLAAWAPRFVQVSIDGAPASHDALRGPGNHAAVVAAVERLVAAGVRTLIAFTAHRGNYREFPEVARLGRRLRVSRVWADRLVPQGQGSRLQGLDPEMTREFIEILRLTRLEADRARSGTEIALNRALQFLAGGPAYRCAAGDTLLTVMPDGTLYPCRRLPIHIGNLLDTPLATLYDSPVLHDLRQPRGVAQGCLACVYERLCRGGLRCLAHASHGATAVADPGCWLARP